MLRGLKKAVNEDIEVKAVSKELWIQHFEQLYENANYEDNEEEEADNEQEENETILSTE